MAIDDDVYGGSSGGPLDLGSFMNTGEGSSGGGLSQAGIGAGIGLAGLGLELFGTAEKAQAEKAYTQSNIAIAGLENQVNQQRQLAMQINARRQQTQQIREVQKNRSLALAAGVAQGGQFGSGVAGGRAQVTAEGAFNLQGINQNLDIGNTIFGLDSQISQQRIAGFNAQSRAATAGAESGFGQALLSAAPTLAKFAMMAG